MANVSLPPITGGLSPLNREPSTDLHDGGAPLMSDTLAEIRALATQSRTSTVAGRDGSPTDHLPTDLDEIPTRPFPKARAPKKGGVKAQALTPMPTIEAEIRRRKNKPEQRRIYGRKEKRKLAHPLEEDRPFFDAWPSNNRGALMAIANEPNPVHSMDPAPSPGPDGHSSMMSAEVGAPQSHAEFLNAKSQLLVGMEDAIRSELQRLTHTFPQHAGPESTNPPAQEVLSPRKLPDPKTIKRRVKEKAYLASLGKAAARQQRQEDVSDRRLTTGDTAVSTNSSALVLHDETERERSGPQFSAIISSEDEYRTRRVQVFSAAAKDFANQFKSYRRLLLWIAHEFDEFAQFCHQNVWSEGARTEYRHDLEKTVEEKHRGEKDRLQAKLLDSQNALTELEARYAKLQKATANSQKVLAQKDEQLAQRDAELADADKGRAGLLKSMETLEKDLWKHKTLLEGPEEQIAALKKVIKEKDLRIEMAHKVFEENNRERAALKSRIEKLEESLRERKRQNAQTVTKSELLAVKRREVEILEQNAMLQTRCSKLTNRLTQAQEALTQFRLDRVTTPRPDWNATGMFPVAPTTAQRVTQAAAEYQQMFERREEAMLELQQLKEMIGELPRGLTMAEDGSASEITSGMLRNQFPKHGLDTKVPTFLKGIGITKNLKLNRMEVQGICRTLWVERDATRITLPVDQFFTKFCHNYCPTNEAVDSFAYSLYYAMHWYAFDPVIAFTREYVTGELEETAFRSMQESVKVIEGVVSGRDFNIGATTRERIKSITDLAQSNDAPAESLGGLVMGSLPKIEVITRLMEKMSTKEEEQLKRLIAALGRDCPGKDVQVRSLFAFDSEEQRFSNFLEEFYTQYLEERAELLSELMDVISSAKLDEDGQVSPPDVSKRIWTVDPGIPAQEMDQLMAVLFDVSVEQLFPSVKADSTFKHVGINGERFYGCDDTVTNDLPSVLAKIRSRTMRRYCLASDAPYVQDKRDRALAAQREKDLERQRKADEAAADEAAKQAAEEDAAAGDEPVAEEAVAGDKSSPQQAEDGEEAVPATDIASSAKEEGSVEVQGSAILSPEPTVVAEPSTATVMEEASVAQSTSSAAPLSPQASTTAQDSMQE